MCFTSVALLVQKCMQDQGTSDFVTPFPGEEILKLSIAACIVHETVLNTF